MTSGTLSAELPRTRVMIPIAGLHGTEPITQASVHLVRGSLSILRRWARTSGRGRL
jgi:hypothetical protein